MARYKKPRQMSIYDISRSGEFVINDGVTHFVMKMDLSVLAGKNWYAYSLMYAQFNSIIHGRSHNAIKKAFKLIAEASMNNRDGTENKRIERLKRRLVKRYQMFRDDLKIDFIPAKTSAYDRWVSDLSWGAAMKSLWVEVEPIFRFHMLKRTLDDVYKTFRNIKHYYAIAASQDLSMFSPDLMKSFKRLQKSINIIKKAEHKARKLARKRLIQELENTVVLDTETTGLGGDDVILEIGVCDLNGNVLIDKRIKPRRHETWSEAQDIHGISPSDVKDCQQFPDIVEELKGVLEGKKVVIFNAEYHVRLLKQTARSHGLDTSWIRLGAVCAMLASGQKWKKHANYYGGMKLTTAADCAGTEFIGSPHSAICDALTTAAVWKEIRK